jgi:hypothetical protein
MKNEAEFKTIFCKSARKQKGYSLRLAAPVLPGIPDMYIVMPGYMPVLLEAKWMVVDIPKFDRQIKYRPMQLNYAHQVNKVQPHALMGLIGVKYLDCIYAILMDIHPTENRISDSFFRTCDKVALQGGYFDVDCLFRRSPIPLLIEAETAHERTTVAQIISRTTGVTDVLRGEESCISPVDPTNSSPI